MDEEFNYDEYDDWVSFKEANEEKEQIKKDWETIRNFSFKHVLMRLDNALDDTENV